MGRSYSLIEAQTSQPQTRYFERSAPPGLMHCQGARGGEWPRVGRELCTSQACIMAYGQTGSGKTHTIYGTSEVLEDWKRSDAAQHGIAPRAVPVRWGASQRPSCISVARLSGASGIVSYPSAVNVQLKGRKACLRFFLGFLGNRPRRPARGGWPSTAPRARPMGRAGPAGPCRRWEGEGTGERRRRSEGLQFDPRPLLVNPTSQTSHSKASTCHPSSSARNGTPPDCPPRASSRRGCTPAG